MNLKWLDRKRNALLIVLASIVLAVGVWFFGPTIGLKSSLARVILVLIIAVTAAIVMWIEYSRARREARLLEDSLKGQAIDDVVEYDAKTSAIDLLRRQFLENVAGLRRSNLKGSNPLYVLPWHLVIGPGDSGKSTLFEKSGLKFQEVLPTERVLRASTHPKRCEWLFCNEGVFLDTKGIYVDEVECREEWLTLVGLLKEHRKSRPVNGVLVVVSLAKLIEGTTEQAEREGRNLRNRVDELIRGSGSIFPVYVLFSKSDLVRGFTEFFEDLVPAEREQIWGCTFPYDTRPDSHPQRRFQVEFNRLLSCLHIRRSQRMRILTGHETASDIFSLPYELASGQEKLSKFVEVLFHPNAFEEAPVFRGFYFTSSIQEGVPTSKVSASLCASSGVDYGHRRNDRIVNEHKAFFSKSVLTDIVCQDSGLSGDSSNTAKKSRQVSAAVITLSGLVMILSFMGLTSSFYRNKDLIDKVGVSAQESLKAVLPGTQPFAHRVAGLNGFRANLSELAKYETSGLPPQLWGGLYRGDSILAPSMDTYFRLFNAVYLEKTRQWIEAALQAGTYDDASLYSDLKLYLMMSDFSHLDERFVKHQLQRLWEVDLNKMYKDQPPQGLLESAQAEIDLYISILSPQRIPFKHVDDHLVQRARLILGKMSAPERYLAKIRLETEKTQVEPYTLNTALQGHKELILANVTSVPAFFTLKGLNESYRGARDKVLKTQSHDDSWVLGNKEEASEGLEHSIDQVYFEEYARQWKRFIRNTKVVYGGTASEDVPAITARHLEMLAGRDSQLAFLLRDVDKNTCLETVRKQSVGTVLAKISGSEESSPSSTCSPVTSDFDSFHKFVSTSMTGRGEGESPLDKYLFELTRVSTAFSQTLQVGATPTAGASPELQEASGKIEALLLRSLDHEIRKDVAPLLLQPLNIARNSAIGGDIAKVNAEWKEQVFPACSRIVSHSYPFRNSKDSDELSFDDLAQYFHPITGTFWKFYKTSAQSWIKEEGSNWVAKTNTVDPMFVDSLRKADAISHGLFGHGASEGPKMDFDVQPYGTPGLDKIALRIDGQELIYQMGKEKWHHFVWPGLPETAGASLEVWTSKQRYLEPLQFDGQWGLFRLLERAQMTRDGDNRYLVEWKLSSHEPQPVKVRFYIKAGGVKNPFVPGLFSGYRCPKRIASPSKIQS